MMLRDGLDGYNSKEHALALARGEPNLPISGYDLEYGPFQIYFECLRYK